jgi:segregation and condensation protein A
VKTENKIEEMLDVSPIQKPIPSGKIDLMSLVANPDWKEMLTDIVYKERMNPWDIDISLLTSIFLQNIRSLKEIDFRIPANAILASSILLRYKADSWVFKEPEPDMSQGMWIPDNLIMEPVIPELVPVIRITKRKVSLDELIGAVEDVIKKEKKKATKRTMQSTVPQILIDMVENQGDFGKLLNHVHDKIKSRIDDDRLVVFSSLLEDKNVDELINYFVPLLHLANNRKVYMWQEKMFGEIFIFVPENGEIPHDKIKNPYAEEKVEKPRRRKKSGKNGKEAS